MSQILKVIKKRRSIRKYTDQEVSQKTINQLLEAAMAAPSAGNAQPWEFIIIDQQEIIEQIPKIHPYASMVKEAAKLLLVCANLEEEIYQGFWVQDCSAATQNILLTAAAKDLGAVWLGIYPEEDRVRGLKRLLNLPEHILPFSLIPIGYPAEIKKASERFRTDKIHYNNW
ncbi:nitroreductase family protein [Orenia marismortui]|uniref:nitroreductase family protein n=1 Tax=Orenia marismortui TaxID=46469 RepID=UPI00036C72DA|nr:nitroreductase family protein [Orenia marismortui]